MKELYYLQNDEVTQTIDGIEYPVGELETDLDYGDKDPAWQFFGVSSRFDFDAEKARLLENLNWYKSMSVQEFTFYRKWESLQSVDIPSCGIVKARIWKPTDINNEAATVKEIETLQPKVIVVKTPQDERVWNTLRKYCHSAEYHNTPGRLIKFLLIDDLTDALLGFACINSEMPALRCRDSLIGFKKDVWMKPNGQGTINNSVQCSTIAATQPLGYNFLGGKLMAAMITTSAVRNEYLERYGDTLVGMTTTSLYGQSSMYNGLKWWKSIGVSSGTILLQPSDSIYGKWHQWVKKHDKDYEKQMTQKEGISGPVTSAKLKVIGMIFSATGLKPTTFQHGFQRGCFYSGFYENGYEFLRGEIDESQLLMKQLFKDDAKAVIDWWKEKAVKRYQALKSEGRLNAAKLFYNQVKGMTYEEAKSRFFNDIGR